MDANQNRREFKFVLPPHLAGVLRARVGELMVADRGAEDGYPILSEYFDTDERTSYWQKQLDVPNRRRVRSRLYGRTDGAIPPSAFVEVKHKLDGVTVKRRIPVSLEDLPQLSAGHIPAQQGTPSAIDERVRAEINDLLNVRGGKPVVQIRYHRYAFDSGPSGTIRITFDIDPRCRFRLIPLTPDDPDFELPLLEPGSAVMEVKTIGPVPFWFRNLIGEYNLVPRGFSKYTAALEMYEFQGKTGRLPRPNPAPTERIVRNNPNPVDDKGRPLPPSTSALPRRARIPEPAKTGGIFRVLALKFLALLHPAKAR
ncbi:polyphosphate polymerase domain-containing protein [Haloferula sp. BvORR071]|uniref:polyphosphate polymerase domain-containing protein n=1 Tax=Haloferula sp. BvORR071 TaxID=1396141 RepID=UPI0005514D4D|nr:polyphosphate polymerase domain-containing protein [Haloferula sp. BvORR071]